jgi:hypothetical protein
MPDATDQSEKLPQLNTTPPSVQEALRALELWQSLDRLYAPVRALENAPTEVAFSINSTPMFSNVPER